MPVDGEPLGAPERYGDDRLFVYLRLDVDPDSRRTERSPRSSRPASRWSRIDLDDALRPRPRSSSAGRSRPRSRARCSASIPSTSPTSRPARSRRGSSPSAYERAGSLPASSRSSSGDGVRLFADEAKRRAVKRSGRRPARGVLRAHFERGRCRRLLRVAGLRRDERRRTRGARSSSATASATQAGRRPVSASARASCTRPVRPTRAARTAGVFLQITATTRGTSRCRARSTRSASSRRRRRAATSRCSRARTPRAARPPHRVRRSDGPRRRCRGGGARAAARRGDRRARRSAGSELVKPQSSSPAAKRPQAGRLVQPVARGSPSARPRWSSSAPPATSPSGSCSRPSTTWPERLLPKEFAVVGFRVQADQRGVPRQARPRR